MPSPIPKPANLRQRRNKTSTASMLPSEAESLGNDVPELPARDGDWHPMVLAWWADVWRSPMASEYLEADKRGLYRLAVLEQDFWTATTPKARLAASAEIRHASLPFGLTPIDRRRLQWSIEQGEAAAEKTSRRSTQKHAPSKGDSRDVLKLA